MTSKRLTLVAGGLLAGTLLLGTAGLAAAQDPTGSPQRGGSRMMGGQGMQNMMGGQGMQNMMGGAAMGSASYGALDAETLKQMQSLHDSMVNNGTVDWSQMQTLHDRMHGTVTSRGALAPTR